MCNGLQHGSAFAPQTSGEDTVETIGRRVGGCESLGGDIPFGNKSTRGFENKILVGFEECGDNVLVFRACERAGGINDFGRRDKLLVVRPVEGGTETYTLNLQDKAILSNKAYFLLPNDVIIVEPEPKKIFNLNLPTYSFILTTVTSAITTTLLLINYYGK